jgi:DNA repair protein RecO (recombination protein O)
MRAYKEADRIVTLLTPEHGRITALARNARRSSRRFGAALDLGNRIDCTLRPPKGAWWGLDAAELQDARTGARSDLERIALLAYACEVCGQLAREDHPEPKLFGLLDMAATLIDGCLTPPSPVFRWGLEAKALSFAGLAPVLGRCARCEGAPVEPMRLALARGGAVHLDCDDAGGVPVDCSWLAVAETARRQPLKHSIDTPVPEGPLWGIASAIEYHLGRGLRSRPVLATLTTGSD